ncbi:hypothetical protein ACPC58_04025 [Streptococcus sp. VTCC 12905]
MLEKVERLISEINRIHLEYSKDYFETGKVEKVNLKHTFTKVPIQPIRAYRLPRCLFSLFGLIGLTYTRLSMTI